MVVNNEGFPKEGREAGARGGIYTASKTKHAPVWQDYRARGWPINSTWIDEAGPGESADLSDLWDRCIREASTAAVLVVYREDEDVLKGGWAEVGAALACGVPVYAVGIEGFTIAKDRRIKHFETLEGAMGAAAHLAAFSARFQAICNTPESRALAALCAPRAALASDPAPAGEAVEPVARCPKPGCGAQKIVGRPCLDWDCPQHTPTPEDTARLREDLERVTREQNNARRREKEMAGDRDAALAEYDDALKAYEALLALKPSPYDPGSSFAYEAWAETADMTVASIRSAMERRSMARLSRLEA